MPGEAWPWKYTMSPVKSPERPRKKWLNPTSYSVALEAYVEMCPPSVELARLALTTMAIAFQRMRLLIRTSVCQSPG